MEEDIVIVESTPGMLEAEILRGLLQSRGIQVWLSHEAAGTVYGLNVGRLGRVDLLVPSKQAEDARKILADYHEDRLANEETLDQTDTEDQ